MRNLSALGPVAPQQPVDAPTREGPMMGILHARVRNEREEEEGTAPGLTAGELVRLLTEYREDPAKLDTLATDYDVDRNKLRRLVQFVSAP